MYVHHYFHLLPSFNLLIWWTVDMTAVAHDVHLTATNYPLRLLTVSIADNLRLTITIHKLPLRLSLGFREAASCFFKRVSDLNRLV